MASKAVAATIPAKMSPHRDRLPRQQPAPSGGHLMERKRHAVGTVTSTRPSGGKREREGSGNKRRGSRTTAKAGGMSSTAGPRRPSWKPIPSLRREGEVAGKAARRSLQRERGGWTRPALKRGNGLAGRRMSRVPVQRVGSKRWSIAPLPKSFGGPWRGARCPAASWKGYWTE